MMRRATVCLSLFLVPVLPAFSQRQSTEYDTGLMPYQSYHGGDLDSVSIANGNLNVDIPLFGYPQRGSKLKLSFSFRYNAKYLTEEAICNDVQDPTDCYNVLTHSNSASQPSIAGWKLVDDQQVTPLFLSYRATLPGESGHDAGLWTYTPMELMTSDGSLHYGGESGFGQVSLDGSGLISSEQLMANLPSRGNWIYDKKGINYAVGGVGIRQDPDGNYIAGGTSYYYNTYGGGTDTMGRVIPPTTTTTDTSGCTGMGAISSVTSWSVPTYNDGSNNGVATYKFCYTVITTYVPAAECGIDTQFDYNGTETVLQSIVLPNGTAWTFDYQARGPNEPSNVNYGEMTKITTPLGATLSYQYEMNSSVFDGACSAWITSRTLDSNDGTGPHTWTYSGGVVTNPDGTSVVHVLNGSEEISTHYLDASGNLLKQIDTAYVPSVGSLNTWEEGEFGTTNNNFPLSKTTTLANGLVSKEVFGYCCTYSFHDYYAYPGQVTALLSTNASYGLQSDVKEYAYGQGAPGPLMRETSTQYLWSLNPAYQYANLLDTPSSTSVYDGSGNLVSMTSYAYDEPSYITNSGVTAQRTAPAQNLLGHVTTTTDWLNTGTSPQTHTNWYDDGVPYQQIDAMSNTAATYAYDPAFAYSLPTTVTNALGHVQSIWYDGNTGLKTSSMDPNMQTTSYGYDKMRRLTSVAYPDGGATNYCYSDSLSALCSGAVTAPSVLITKLQNPATLKVELDVDGVGRKTTQQMLSDPQGTDYIKTIYDSLGRVQSVTNPYRSSDTVYTTSYTYDALGRKTTETEADGSTLKWCYDNVAFPASSACQSNHSSVSNVSWVDSVDEAGHPMQHASDALGRLLAVMEPDPNSNSLALETDYTYDTLGNLLNVGQVGKPGTINAGFVSPEVSESRSFTYDSLSRLLSSTNPEAGFICYGAASYGSGQGSPASCPSNGYDLNGNLQYKTDARGVLTIIRYDALNRPTLQYGMDGSVADNYYYDAGPYGIGHMFWADHSGVAGEGFYFDKMGRVTTATYSNPINGGAWNTAYTAQYDLAGNPTQIVYHNQRTVSQTWDGAGRLATVTDTTPGGSGTVYLSGPQAGGVAYLPSGAETASYYDNGIVSQNFYFNPRLQPSHATANSSSLPTVASGANLLDRQVLYNGGTTSPCGADANNGNIRNIVDNLKPEWSQNFTYDCLNRLTFGSRNDGLTGYNEIYNYDSFGNMIRQDNLHSNVLFDIDYARNQLLRRPNGSTPVSGHPSNDFQYDASGNMTSSGTSDIPGGHSYFYNTLNQIAWVDWGTPAVVDYLYDGLDQRIAKITPQGSTGYIYMGSQPLAEFDQNGNWTDYIYANGKKIAKIDGVEPVFNLHGFRDGSNAACGAEGPWTGAGGTNLTIQPGDMLVMDFKQTLPSDGGLALIFTNGSGGVTTDTATGQSFWLNNQADGQWHHMVGSLAAYNNLTIAYAWLGIHQVIPNGTFDLYFANVGITHSDGSTTPIYWGQAGSVAAFTGTNCGGQQMTSGTTTISAPDPMIATHYYLDDHLGTTQMELSSGGWPVWQGQFTPFGGELPDGSTAMHYKFTGKERDTETGLDDFGARYLSSNIGRWMSPDWAAHPQAVPYASLGSPQSLNLYAYVANNPLSQADIDGHRPGEPGMAGAPGMTGAPGDEPGDQGLGWSGMLGSGAEPPQWYGDMVADGQEALQQSAQQQSTNSATTTVTLNSRAADIPGGQVLHDVGINHEWISTPDGVSVGMGTAKGVPQSDAPGVKTQVVDHTGEVPTSTETFTGVNKAALATYTQVGTPTGRWIPGVNDCNTWAHNAINQSTPHDISIVIYGVPTVIAHNAVVYADGSIH